MRQPAKALFHIFHLLVKFCEKLKMAKITNKKAPRLGRGLDVLLGQVAAVEKDQSADNNNLKIINIDLLQRGKYQPRNEINPDTLKELADSIISQGIIQPLVVRKINSEKYEIIAGERRWLAGKIAGLTQIPVIVRNIDDQVALAISLIENIQRESLTAIEEAKALQQLLDDFNMTHKEVAQVVGRSRSSVSNLIRLLQLNDKVKQLLSNGALEMGHARALLPLTSTVQLQVAHQVMGKYLSVRQTEELVKKILNPDKKPAVIENPELNILMQSLSKKLATKTEIKYANNKGRIVIHYQSSAQLNAILKHIH